MSGFIETGVFTADMPDYNFIASPPYEYNINIPFTKAASYIPDGSFLVNPERVQVHHFSWRNHGFVIAVLAYGNMGGWVVGEINMLYRDGELWSTFSLEDHQTDRYTPQHHPEDKAMFNHWMRAAMERQEAIDLDD